MSLDPQTARANIDAATKRRADTKRAMEADLATALAALQILLDTPNNQINTAAALKDLARGQRRIIRLLTGRLDGAA